jgi:hypothetical protein
MALRCARGETGHTTIRSGRRQVELTPLGGLLFLFDCAAAIASAARLAAAVREAPDIDGGEAILSAMGIRTELAYERQTAQ